jgi:hypothetical protein
MLARGALCRLAADVPKTSTHDLPRISQLLRTSLFARHGASQPTVGAIARAFRATILQGRRAYATKSATEPTARVKKEVKKAVAAKKPAAKTTTAKKPAPKKPARKTALKKRPAPKKPAAKKPKKVRTAEEVQVEQIKALKKRALLRGVPKRPHASAWNAFASEALKGSKNIADSQTILKETSVKYRNLTPAEREVCKTLLSSTTKLTTAVALQPAWHTERRGQACRVQQVDQFVHPRRDRRCQLRAHCLEAQARPQVQDRQTDR